MIFVRGQTRFVLLARRGVSGAQGHAELDVARGADVYPTVKYQNRQKLLCFISAAWPSRQGRSKRATNHLMIFSIERDKCEHLSRSQWRRQVNRTRGAR